MSIEVRGSAPLLGVHDVDLAIAFYRDSLGFEVVQTADASYEYGWALLRLGDAELMLNGAYKPGSRPPAPDPDRVKGHGDTSIYFGCPDVAGAAAYLRGRGVVVDGPAMTSYGFMSLAVVDPDGYNLVFHWPATEEASGNA